MKDTQTILLHCHAPRKPSYGEFCNGCGVCCAVEPCPMAYAFLWQFSGRCHALLWQDSEQRYVCGMVVSPEHYLKRMPRSWVARFSRWFAVRIAVGRGCDSTVNTLTAE